MTNPANYLGGGRDLEGFPTHPARFRTSFPATLLRIFQDFRREENSLQTFVQIMRTGLDTDHVHPTCAGAPNGNRLPPPFNGDLLQIMPWPGYQFLTDHDLSAIYTYLAAIPWVEAAQVSR